MVHIEPNDDGKHPANWAEHRKLDRMLDMALELTFPGSDPVAITILPNETANASKLGEGSVKATTMPDDCEPYRQTPVFTQDTIPAGLLRAHRTAAGVWALIHVMEGRLLYRVNEPVVSETVIDSGRPGVIEPAVSHEVAPLGPVRFYVEFHRKRR